MSFSNYDLYLGDTACNIRFTSETATVEYPTKDIVNIFGPIYTPRVYGSNLTALEIASSGSVTIALNDVHALDLWNSSGTTYIQSMSNNSLKLVAGALSNASVTLSTTNFDVSTYSQSNVNFSASNNVVSTACNNIQLTSGANTTVTSAYDFSVTAASNVSLTATNKSLSLSSHSGAMTFVMNDLTDNATLTTAKNTVIVAHNNFTATADSNATVEGVNESVFLKAHNSAVQLTLDHVTDSIIGLAAGDFSVNAGDQINLAGSNAVAVSSATNSVGLTAATVSTVTGGTGVNLTASTGDVYSLAVVGSVVANAATNITNNAAGSISSSASNNVTLTAATGTLATAATAGAITETAGTTITNTAGTGITSTATTGNVSTAATAGSVVTTAGTNITDSAAGSLTYAASNNVTVNAVTGAISLNSKEGMDFTSSNNSYYMYIRMDESTGTMAISATNGVQITGGGGDAIQNTNTQYVFNVQGNQVVAIDSNGLQITGILDSVGIHETELWIQDKLVMLSIESNNAFVQDGAVNDGAGFRVWGNPYGTASNENPKYLKSLTWNKSVNGMLDLGGSHKVGTEAFWELKGGHFRLTHTKNDTGKYVSYAWRVNDADELEFVKITATASNAAPLYKTIAKFGQTGTVV
jgi:uncharacterized protein (DUF2345 family)